MRHRRLTELKAFRMSIFLKALGGRGGKTLMIHDEGVDDERALLRRAMRLDLRLRDERLRIPSALFFADICVSVLDADSQPSIVVKFHVTK